MTNMSIVEASASPATDLDRPADRFCLTPRLKPSTSRAKFEHKSTMVMLQFEVFFTCSHAHFSASSLRLLAIHTQCAYADRKAASAWTASSRCPWRGDWGDHTPQLGGCLRGMNCLVLWAWLLSAIPGWSILTRMGCGATGVTTLFVNIFQCYCFLASCCGSRGESLERSASSFVNRERM